MNAALITGATSRIGSEIAREFAKRKYNLVLHYNSAKDKAEALKSELKQNGHTIALLKADLTNKEEVNALFQREELSSLNITHLVNNASIFKSIPAEKETPQIRTNHFKIHRDTPISLSQQFTDQCKSKKITRALIINLTDSYLPDPSNSYIESKRALNKFTKDFAKECADNYQETQIRVNAIAPGWTLDPEGIALTEAALKHLKATTPFARKGNPKDVIQALKYFLESNTTGQILSVDGRNLYTK